MSGGSLDYIYYKVEEAGLDVKRNAKTNLHKLFGNHLLLVSKALKDLEWEFSGDSSENSADGAIKEVLGKSYKIKELIMLKEEAKDILHKLQESINNLEQE